MRSRGRPKAPLVRDRAELIRKRRADSSTVRETSPNTERVSVVLEFLPIAAPPHVAQSFFLYPAARAFFEYPCPYGDCDGIYDVGTAATQVLSGAKRKVAGVVECTGNRSRDGKPNQPCGLQLSYAISAERSADAVGTAGSGTFG